MISQRDVILVPFPFSDQSGTKVRPALVLSKDGFNLNSRDAIVCGITSNLSKEFYSVKVEQKDLEEGRIEISMVKVENLAKMAQSLVIKKIAKLNVSKFEEVLGKLDTLFKE